MHRDVPRRGGQRSYFDAGKDSQTGNKPGTVGHPLPGVAAKIVDPVTFEPFAPNNRRPADGERFQSHDRLPGPAAGDRRVLP